MGGGANNKAVHNWARKFNMTTGSLVKDWEDEEEGEADFQQEMQEDEDERAELEEAEQEFSEGSAEQDNERRRLDLGWEDQAEVLELGERVATAQKVLSGLPPLEWPDPDREKLVAWGTELKRSADGYFLKHLQDEAAAFEAAVEEERKAAPEKARLQHDWEAQADVQDFAERVAAARKILSGLPALEEPDPERVKLVAWGEELSLAAEGYVLSRLSEEVGPFEAAVEEERKGAPEKARLQHEWEGQADVLDFGNKVDAALEMLGKLPPLPDRSEGRADLIRQGEALKKAVDNYELKRLGREVPGFLHAARTEETETREAVRAAEEIAGLFGEIVEILDAAVKIPGVLPGELQPLAGLRESAKSAADTGDLTALKKLYDTCSGIVDGLLRDLPAIKKRLEALVAGQKPDKLISAVWEMFQRAGGQRKDLGIGQQTYYKVVSLNYTPPSVYKIAAKQDCINHALARHTFAGILREGKILTAHVSMVAIFERDSDLSGAVNSVSTDPKKWLPLRNGFDYCDVGLIRLYGNIIDDTVSLQTCFPLRGAAPEYDQATVQMGLNHAQGSLVDFKRLVKGQITPEALEEEREEKRRKEREEREKREKEKRQAK